MDWRKNIISFFESSVMANVTCVGRLRIAEIIGYAEIIGTHHLKMMMTLIFQTRILPMSSRRK